MASRIYDDGARSGKLAQSRLSFSAHLMAHLVAQLTAHLNTYLGEAKNSEAILPGLGD